jgi:hypothetical protein
MALIIYSNFGFYYIPEPNITLRNVHANQRSRAEQVPNRCNLSSASDFEEDYSHVALLFLVCSHQKVGTIGKASVFSRITKSQSSQVRQVPINIS